MKKPSATTQGVPFHPKGMSVSSVHFQVHPGIEEVRAAAQAQGWGAVSAETEEVHFTTDGWKTARTVKAGDQPPPLAADGRIFLPDVPQGTEVEFALLVGLRPVDGGARSTRAEVWLNNGGQNYRQVTK
jgi:hypothetical protein